MIIAGVSLLIVLTIIGLIRLARNEFIEDQK